jgi:soluble cytochrome b562
MKKGLLKPDQTAVEQMVENIQSNFEKLIEFLREKHELAEEWSNERSDKWQESQAAEDFEEWLNDLDYRIDTIESLKDELDIDEIKEIF